MSHRSYHHGDLARALRTVARAILERHGPEETTLRAVAREAGVSAAAPYHHYADRDALLAAVAEQGFAELAESMKQRAEGRRGESQLTQLQAAGVAYVRFAVRNPQLFRLMFSRLLGNRSAHPDLDMSAARAFGVLDELLGGIGGDGRGSKPTPVALTAWSTVHGLATLLIDGRLGECPTERQAARVAREVTRVLGAGLRDASGYEG